MSRTTRRAPATSTHGPIPGATVGDRRPPRRTMEVRVGKRHDRLWACPSRLACQHRVDPTAFTRRPALRIVSRTGPARARPGWGHQCAGLAFGPKETEQPADLGKSDRADLLDPPEHRGGRSRIAIEDTPPSACFDHHDTDRAGDALWSW
jgi:hypothetical protein